MRIGSNFLQQKTGMITGNNTHTYWLQQKLTKQHTQLAEILQSNIFFAIAGGSLVLCGASKAKQTNSVTKKCLNHSFVWSQTLCVHKRIAEQAKPARAQKKHWSSWTWTCRRLEGLMRLVYNGVLCTAVVM